MTAMNLQERRRPPEAGAALAGRVFTRVALLGAAAAAVLFSTAGALDYWEAKAWLAAILAPTAILAFGFLKSNPEVLLRRLGSAGPPRRERKLVGWFAPLFVLAFLVPGLDWRFKWSDADVETVPAWLALGADVVVVCGILFGGYVLQFVGEAEQKNQGNAVLTTGPYHLIRHPLFAASAVVWLATPLALGSWMALPAFLLASSYYLLELRQQEKVLLRSLPGYAAYCRRTPFRLIPFVW